MSSLKHGDYSNETAPDVIWQYDELFPAGLPFLLRNISLNDMSTLNISLTESLQGFVDEQVRQRGYSTSSEYLHELIRQDQERQQLRLLLLEGASSEAAETVNAKYFSILRQRVKNYKTGN
ncbi:MAG TPA: hypothetical protein VL003_11505 [Pusillimonas sp.]|uniref:ribbon-helix-helix domain-containing protein n=1 Tax=Pusillimonas sp. TaxID=3040095 RepID=UPI002CF22E17|nr:hypothetical protein [Pusillimonas sp.]HUH88656.1 hypothetical protein [Pusillimonas sp.]